MGKGTPQNSLQGNQAHSVQHVITASTYQRKRLQHHHNTPSQPDHPAFPYLIHVLTIPLSVVMTTPLLSPLSPSCAEFITITLMLNLLLSYTWWIHYHHSMLNPYHHSSAESFITIPLLNPLPPSPCWVHYNLNPPCWIQYHHLLLVAESITTISLLNL